MTRATQYQLLYRRDDDTFLIETPEGSLLWERRMELHREDPSRYPRPAAPNHVAFKVPDAYDCTAAGATEALFVDARLRAANYVQASLKL